MTRAGDHCSRRSGDLATAREILDIYKDGTYSRKAAGPHGTAGLSKPR